MTEHPVSLRIDQDTFRRIELLGAALIKQTLGATLKRGAILRLAVERGLDVLERELAAKIVSDEQTEDGSRVLHIEADSKAEAIRIAKHRVASKQVKPKLKRKAKAKAKR